MAEDERIELGEAYVRTYAELEDDVNRLLESMQENGMDLRLRYSLLELEVYADMVPISGTWRWRQVVARWARRRLEEINAGVTSIGE